MRMVLVVDDDPGFREALREMLERAGMRVQIASTADEATDKLKGTLFDAVLSDIVMPGTGFTVVNQARAIQPATPVILMTGYETVESKSRADRDGAFAYLTKPLLPDQLLCVLNGAFDHRDHRGH